MYSAPCSSIASNSIADPQGTAELVIGFIYDGVDPTEQLLTETVTGGRLNVFNSLEMLMLDCDPTLGCIDSIACNYSDLAITDIGNCLYFDECLVCGGDNSTCSGCLDNTANNFDSEATLEDGSCCYLSLTYTVDDSNVLCFDDNASIIVIASGAVGAADSVFFELGNSPLYQNYTGIYNQSVGSYSVVAIDLNGCSASIQIVVEGPEPLQITLDATGDMGGASGMGTATADGGTGDYTFVWVDSTTGEEADPNALEDGVYNVIVTDSNGCIEDGNVYVDDVYGLNDLDPLPFTLGPNPTSSFVTMQFNAARGVSSVDIYDGQGRILYSDQVVVGDGMKTLDLSEFPNGLYSITLRGDAGFSVRQVAVQR
jgi:hypothetical protein